MDGCFADRVIDRMTSQQLFPLTDRHPDEIIAYRSGAKVSVGQFLAEVSVLARHLPRHRYVVNLHVDRYLYMRSFYAAIVAGQCTLLPPNRQPQTLEQLAETYSDCYTVNAETEYEIRDVADSEMLAAPKISADQLCAIAFTSGSTGTPQATPKLWRTLRSGSLSNRRLLLAEQRETLNIVATVPAQHMWGLETSILLPMFANVAVCDQVPFFPQDIATALASIPAPRALVSSPIHLEALLKSGVETPEMLTVLTATAPLSRELALQLETQLNVQVMDIFGCSESGILAVRNASADAIWTLSDVFELRSLRDGTEICADHLLESVLMPDHVELVDQHQFRWIGRLQDIVNIAGKRGSFTDLNHRLREIRGILDGVIFMPAESSNRLAALVVAPSLDVSDILKELKSQVEPVFLPRPILHVAELPRQETGKLSLKAVQQIFEATRKARG